MRNTMKAGLIMLVAVAGLIFSGCGDKKKDDPAPGKKTGKFTITVTGMSPTDYDGAVLTLGGVLVSNEKTLWKVNGVARTNEPNIGFIKTDLISGNTFVIETTMPLDGIAVSLSCQNFEAPFTLAFKAEVNGDVVQNINQSITSTFDRTWNY